MLNAAKMWFFVKLLIMGGFAYKIGVFCLILGFAYKMVLKGGFLEKVNIGQTDSEFCIKWENVTI